MCEGETNSQLAKPLGKDGQGSAPPSPSRRPLSPRAHPDAKPITTGMYLEPHHLAGRLYQAHYLFQIPMYYIKFIIGQLIGLWSIFFWHLPTDQDIVEMVEGSSLTIVLRRDKEVEEAEKATFSSRKGSCNEGAVPLYETRHYYIDVKRCELDLLVRDRGTTYKEAKGRSILLKSWSMRYTKTRRRAGLSGGPVGFNKVNENSPEGPWECKLVSFVVNGKPFYERENMYALLFHYHTAGTHTKSHMMGGSLADRILLDDRVTEKLSESTWTTTALHYGLVYGSKGPMTHPRNDTNRWMALGAIPTCASLLAEGDNMSALGPHHADKKHWAELEIPFADFLLNARMALSSAMKKNDIPQDLHEAIFLSCIMHATDHILLHRITWGKAFNIDPHGLSGTCYDFLESAAWRYMWVEPTLNPIRNNKICRLNKPFYRQLYLGLKEVDTFNVADQITASIMY